jgi:hypothetical protein
MSIEKCGLENKRKILIISQYFWPENFRINDIAKSFNEDGHEVTILTGLPNYPKGVLFDEYKKDSKKFNNYQGCEVVRVPVFLRGKGSKFNLFLNYISFNISSIIFGIIYLRKKKFDIIFTFGTSPVTVAVTSIFFSKIKKAKNILWVLDLWPDVIYELNIIRNKFIIFLIRKLIKYIYKKSDLILAQSNSFRFFISKSLLFSEIRKVVYFPSWPEFEGKIDTTEHKLKFNKIFNILFTGNIGESQNFDLVIKIAIKFKKNENIKWTIVGEGRSFDYLKKQVKLNNIKNFFLEGQKDISEIESYYKSADLLLVSLKPENILSLTIPGKFQSYLITGKPILGLIGGELEKIINSNKLGFASASQDVDFLYNNILKLTQLSEGELLNIKFASMQLLKNDFNKKRILNLLNQKIHSLFLDKAVNTINLLNNSDLNFLPENYILSGLNLAFVGSYSSGEVPIENNIFHWPDGLFKRRFFNKQIKKISGRSLIKELKISKDIKRIIILGNSSDKQVDYIKHRFKLEVLPIKLPYADSFKLLEYVPFNITNEDLIILTLPTPKQEQLAILISFYRNNYKILCIGGALSMIVGDEKPVPEYLENVWGAEALWRLKRDTFRRTVRLFKTFYYYILGEILGRFKNIKGNIIE